MKQTHERTIIIMITIQRSLKQVLIAQPSSELSPSNRLPSGLKAPYLRQATACVYVLFVCKCAVPSLIEGYLKKKIRITSLLRGRQELSESSHLSEFSLRHTGNGR